MAKKWMSKAFAGSHGQFRKKAQAAGMSTSQYAHHVLAEGSGASTHTKRQAALALKGISASKGRASRGERWYGRQ